MCAIEVTNLKKRFKYQEALKGISFNVKKREIFGLLGPNGAGKSTTINILAGLLERDAGHIKILGQDPSKVKEQMNVTSAFTYLPGWLKVYQNLKVYAKIYGVKNADSRIDDLLDMFNIPELKYKRFAELSSGQRARVMLCKGMINHPKVLLLDEATVGLDPDIAEETRRIIKGLKKQTSILFTSHNMREVEELCDRLAILDKGLIKAEGTAAHIKKIMKKKTLEEVFIKIAREGHEVV